MPKTIYAEIAWGLDHQNGLDFNNDEITQGHDHQTGLELNYAEIAQDSDHQPGLDFIMLKKLVVLTTKLAWILIMLK